MVNTVTMPWDPADRLRADDDMMRSRLGKKYQRLLPGHWPANRMVLAAVWV
jgi:hypothetical protein